ncbi:MAG: hypothetical protein QM813_09340 [Verrucomicrobiota bacterium]
MINGPETEDTIRLKRENAEKDQKIVELQQTVKARETTISVNQDKHDQYRKQVEAGEPVPVKPGSTARRFLRR